MTTYQTFDTARATYLARKAELDAIRAEVEAETEAMIGHLDDDADEEMAVIYSKYVSDIERRLGIHRAAADTSVAKHNMFKAARAHIRTLPGYRPDHDLPFAAVLGESLPAALYVRSESHALALCLRLTE